MVVIFSFIFYCCCTREVRKHPRRDSEGEKIMKHLLRLWEEEQGQDLVEYALLVVLISLGAVASMKALAQAVSDAFSNAGANLTSATT